MILDCHTHCYPEEVHADPRAWAEPRGELHWADLVAPIGRKSIQDWATPQSMVEAMDEAGVSKAVLLGWYWENGDSCRWHNEVIADWVKQEPERFIGFASILPDKSVVEQLEHAKTLGLSGVGELHPGVQGFSSESTAWQEMADWCSKNRWPVNFHCTSEYGNDHPSAIPTPLADYLAMAEQSPELKIILAHWGGGLALHYEDALPENIFFDCSASPLMYPFDVFRKVVDRIGTKQILFGSDYPLRIFPKAQKHADMLRYIDQIRSEAGLSEEEFTAVTSGNFRRLIGA